LATVASVSASQLRAALRFAATCQPQLARAPIEERVAVAKLLLSEYAKRRNEIAWGLAQFRGQTVRDTFWMCDEIENWACALNEFVTVVFGRPEPFTDVRRPGSGGGRIQWQSRGTASVFASSTMDGPPVVTLLCHAILAGTHVILRPGWKDVVSHIAFDILHDNALANYAQLVRWDSDSVNSPLLCRALLTGAAQNLLFSSDETFQQIMGMAAGGDPARYHELLLKSRRYGTGLPLVVVTSRCDVRKAAHDLVAGCRLGGGRFCLSTTPVLVEECCREELASSLVDVASALQAGDLLDFNTELCRHDPHQTAAIRDLLGSFGGSRIYGSIDDQHSDIVIVVDVKAESPCLHREIPASVLCLIPYGGTDEAVEIALGALRKNHREAWTALGIHGSMDDAQFLAEHIPAFRVLHGGVPAEGGLLMPHQGSYFVQELMRRVTFEPRGESGRTNRHSPR